MPIEKKGTDVKFRKCHVLREQEIDLGSLVKGDIYRLGKASETDHINEKQYNVCRGDAFPIDPPGNASVMSKPVVLVSCLEINAKISNGKITT